MGPRAAAVLGAAALALAAGCGDVYVGPDEDPTVGRLRCEQPSDRPSGMHVLLAQAVPTGFAVPCLRRDVGDWMVTAFDVRDGSARIEFTYMYGPEDTATVEVAARCDVRGAGEVSTQLEGVNRYRRPATRAGRHADEVFYVYAGACTTLRFSLSGRSPFLRGSDILDAIGFVPRDRLDEQIQRASDGNLHLDPDEQ